MIEQPCPAAPTRVTPPKRPPVRVAVRRLEVRRVLATVLLASAAVVLLAAPASAHAVLTGSDPANGAALETSPEVVTLRFNEPVIADAQSLRVFDVDATRVDDGPVETADDQLAVTLPDLPEGAYVIAYRVVSDDSHPIAGTLTFTVGDAAPLDADTAAAIAGVDAGALGTTGAVLRGAGYLAVLLAAGAVAFAAFVGRRAVDRRRAGRLGWAAALAAIVVTALHLPVQAAAVSGLGLVATLTGGSALGATVTSGFGTSALLRIAALVVLAIGWHRVRTGADRQVGPWLWFGGATALGSYLLDGHQRTTEPSWLLLSGDAIHLAGAAVWAGGLALLYATLRARRREDDPVGAARVVARFSSLALWSVLALTLAGTAMSLPLVRSLDALTSTTYGWLLLAKVVLVAVVAAIAAYNRRSLVPAIVVRAVPAGAAVDSDADAAPEALAAADPTAADTDDAWQRLTGTVRLELVALALIALLTGFLVTTQPAAEAAGLTGPVAQTAALTDDLEVDLIVDPADPGVNAVHVFVVEPSGQPSDRIEDLRLEFTYVDEGIGPITFEPLAAGPGHWTGNLDELTFAGAWEVRIIAGEDRFTQHEVTIPFDLAS